MQTGTTIGNYEIVCALGAGGMGEVYRAKDTKLGRDVAIKILPEDLARDQERLNRFERRRRQSGPRSPLSRDGTYHAAGRHTHVPRNRRRDFSGWALAGVLVRRGRP
jgi:hypothetical protein